ncbi:L-threonine dehydratase biosynthetic IlvA [Nymphon striatum]|nr:L-threonine dehydratase biosynthetic IlvA [Nymphon striatum]
MFHLSEGEKKRGVVAASAGNHAQGVAIAGAKLGIKATIVMPKITPDIKVKGVQSHGGIAVLHGNTFDDAYAHAMELCEKEGMTFIHPFDDLDVIAGQGTIGMELLRQHPDPIDAIFVCVEHEEAPSMTRAIEQGERVLLDSIGTFADGAAVRQAGKNTFEIASDLVDEMILVSTDETCAAIKDVFEDTRTLLEPAGALGVAGLKKYIEEHQLKDKQLIAISSGANINFDRLRHVAERAELGRKGYKVLDLSDNELAKVHLRFMVGGHAQGIKDEVLYRFSFPERPGALLHFLTSMGGIWNISLFHYRNHGSDFGRVLTGIQVPEDEREKF